MAKTLLNAVNEILERVGVIAGDADALTTLTDSARQRWINVGVQVVNEGIDELYSIAGMAKPQGQGSSAITLVASTQSYSLATDLVRLRWPIVDKTNAQYLYEYPGGYNQLLVEDPEQDDTGLPYYGCIGPTDGLLYLDRKPTSTEAGRIYTYQYDKDLELTVYTDTVPFTNVVFRSMVPAWSEIWKREMRKEFDEDFYDSQIGRAARLLSQRLPRKSYSPR